MSSANMATHFYLLYERCLRVIVPNDVWGRVSDAELEQVVELIRSDSTLNLAFNLIQKRLNDLTRKIEGAAVWE